MGSASQFESVFVSFSKLVPDLVGQQTPEDTQLPESCLREICFFQPQKKIPGCRGGEGGQAYKKNAFEKEVISPTLCASHRMTKPVLMTELLCADMCGGSFYHTRLHCTERLCSRGPQQLWALRSTGTISPADSEPCQGA